MEIIAKGAYVLATKYSDGDPGDAWAVGYYLGPSDNPNLADRYLVGDKDGKPYRASGYRRARAGLKPEVGRWLIENAQALERSPPGSINLWAMLTDNAWESAEDAETGSVGKDDESGE